MASYVSIRGWLECTEEHIAKIKDITNYFSENYSKYNIDPETIELYQKGWRFPIDIVNWTSYVFYGGDIKKYNSDFIKEQIIAIVESEKEIEGHFFLDDDEGKIKLYWKLLNGKLIEHERNEK